MHIYGLKHSVLVKCGAEINTVLCKLLLVTTFSLRSSTEFIQLKKKKGLWMYNNGPKYIVKKNYMGSKLGHFFRKKSNNLL